MENIFIILLGLSMIYIASTSRLAAHVNMLIIQGWLLFFVCLSGIAKEPSGLESIMASMPHIIGFLFIVIETLIVKALVIPIFLKKVVKKDSRAQRYGCKYSSLLLFSYIKRNFICRIFDC